MIKLQQGIVLHILPTSKFKTISIQLRFRAPLQADIITKRTLLANMLEVNSKYYPTQIDFRKKLSELYGATFFTDVARYGNYHVLSLNVDCVDEKIIQKNGIFKEVMTFIHQAIFVPNVCHGKFHEATFAREVENLRDDYLSRYDDKAVYADDKLNALYFDLPEHQMLSYGQISDLNDTTSSETYETYLRMIKEDQIDIFIVGNVTEEEVILFMQSFDFSPRVPLRRDPFYLRDNSSKIREETERQEINQTILTMGFTTPVYYHGNYYYAGLVFNGLFGGMTHSKLFQTVREEENIAYAISSDIDAFRGLLSVEAGIDYKDIKKTQSLIIQKLQEIQEGHFTDDELFQTKELLKSELHQIDDSPHAMIENRYSLSLIEQNDLTIDDWIERIDGVKREEVALLAQLINLKAIFKLIGENN
ncbi:Predicted Zn-dependent peptidase [Alkalibacterium subtropicum]|uniref:Predicted Zn-dependent peptidase n=1 Tax=Alkalibacterium subtropicum TaxID=753702 RepID=A0A1I1E815_9LACT|nr:pitrilysin family protein [Alkalibacterium subtropicum]SFB82826.1 Predicted Zn-dependent peptidase [Alkalibacterium subtropicum]